MYNNYIIIGDSITYGIGDTATGGWSNMLKNYIVDKDNLKACSNSIHIAGFPGATSSDILNKLDYIYNSFKDDFFHNIVILAIGINDTQEFNGDSLISIKQFCSNIKEIYKYFTQHNAELIIVGLTKIEYDDSYIWKLNDETYNRDLQEIIRFDNELERICKENQIKYIPMQDILKKEDFADGLHPNHNGYKKMYERILDNIND